MASSPPPSPPLGEEREKTCVSTPNAVRPRLQLKCFTAIEILHLAWLAKKTVEQTLREFLESTYEAGATLGNWDRRSLERPQE